MGPVSLLFVVTSLMVCTTNQATLHVEPERLQFFQREIMRLSCEDKGWLVKRNTSLSAMISCEDWGGWKAPNCGVDHLSPQYDSGVYWCESSEGQTTPSLDITVTDGPVLLQSPVLPVPEGQNIALTCRHRTSSKLPARFYHDGRLLSTQPSGHMTITRVSASHGGRYSCEIGGDRSESSHIHVTENISFPSVPASDEPQTNATPPALQTTPTAASLTDALAARSPLVALVCHVVVLCPYVVSTVLLVSVHRHRNM